MKGRKGGDNVMKMKIEVLVIIFLAVVLLPSTLLISATTSTAVYNPWYDLDGDGEITIYDVVKVTGIYHSSGDPFTALAALQYDSGWTDITDKAGQYFNITHGLNSTDIIVDITGKAAVDGGPHQRNIGGTSYTQGWNKTYGGTNLDYARSVVQTVDGGYALAGPTWSFGAGGNDFWLVKTDSFGNAHESWLFGLVWTDSTADTVILYRGATDACWNYVRVRIWKIKETA